MVMCCQKCKINKFILYKHIRYALFLLEKIVNPSHSNNLGYKEPENKMTQSVFNTRFHVHWLMQEISQ